MVGGKARSYVVPGTGSGGREDLPAEFGWHGMWGTYQHFPETLSRVPTPRGTANDNLILLPAGTPGVYGSLAESFFRMGPGGLTTPQILADEIGRFLGVARNVKPQDIPVIASKVAALATSGRSRQFGQLEHITLNDYIGPGMPEGVNDLMRAINSQVTMPDRLNARNAATGNIHLFSGYLGTKGLGRGARDVLGMADGPINSCVFDPMKWAAERNGARFHMNHRLTALQTSGGEISGATVVAHDGRSIAVDADWYVLAVPFDKAADLMSPQILALDPSLEGIKTMTQYENWLGCMQLYTKERFEGAPLGGTNEWGLLWAAYSQMWSGPKFKDRFGDGNVTDYLTTDCVDWHRPGLLYGKPANLHSKEEYIEEVFHQFKKYGNFPLEQADLAALELNPAFYWKDGKMHNDEPDFANYPGCWAAQPEAVTKVPNLFLASAYVRSIAGVESMEAANEAARQSVNAIIDRSGVDADKCWLDSVDPPPALAALWQDDDNRYNAGLPNRFDVVAPYLGGKTDPTPWPGY